MGEGSLELVQNVVAAAGSFAGVTFLLMEFLVKPLTKGIKKTGVRSRLRTVVSVLAPVVFATSYLASVGTMPWATAPLICAIAFGTAWLTHKQRNKNDAADLEATEGNDHA